MVAHIYTITFQGLETKTVDVQVHMTSGLPTFQIVGLADKAVTEAKERVRSSLSSIGLSMPAKRIIVNLSPAHMAKEGAYYDLPIALGVLTEMDVLPMEKMLDFLAMGELSLDGTLNAVNGVLPGAIHANALNKTFICPYASRFEATWAGQNAHILAPKNLGEVTDHIAGRRDLPAARPIGAQYRSERSHLDMRDIKGQESAKRALIIAAAGAHNMLLIGPPGAGKSMLAARLPSILPPMESQEILDVSIIYSIAGLLKEGKMVQLRPFRAPHFTTSAPALIGGSNKAKPGEISLAHRGVLFLDELPEFSRHCLESLRQPIETGEVTIARVNVHASYPANFQLVAAMNPCRCGNVDNVTTFCKRGEKCAQDYQGRISAPLYDRFDIFVCVPAVPLEDLALSKKGKASMSIRETVKKARRFALQRLKKLGINNVLANADLAGEDLEKTISLSTEAASLLEKAHRKIKLTARAYYRMLKVARTIADLECSPIIEKNHLAESLSYRRKS